MKVSQSLVIASMAVLMLASVTAHDIYHPTLHGSPVPLVQQTTPRPFTTYQFWLNWVLDMLKLNLYFFFVGFIIFPFGIVFTLLGQPKYFHSVSYFFMSKLIPFSGYFPPPTV